MENLTPSNFAVVFTEPSPEGIERLRHHYPHLYELVDGSVFVVRHAGLSSEVLTTPASRASRVSQRVWSSG